MSFDLLAFVLGIVEGLTEFLPISSTGHLIVFGNILSFTGDRADTFEIFIQIGAMMAVVVLYVQRFLLLIPRQDGLTWLQRLTHGGFRGWTGLFKLAAGCLPAFIIGFLAHSFIKTHLFSPVVVAYSLIIGGIILFFFPEEKITKKTFSLDQISLLDACKVGCFQVLALCPGVSRAASTIVGGICCGMRREVAAEFSFFLAVPTIIAAAGYDIFKSRELFHREDLAFFAIGTIVSFIAALIAIRTFISLLQRYSLRPWGLYRIIFGLLVLYFFEAA
jgi:undecaprenyl-diphosphatase